MKYRNIFLVLILFTASKVFAQNLYFPSNSNSDWEKTDPALLGWNVENMDSLFHYLETTNSKAFIVLKDGKIAIEKYFGSFTRDSLWYWASAGKTLTSMLVGIAQEEGYLDIDSSSSDYLGTGWTSCSAEKEKNIKIFNQLTMTSGLNDLVADPYCTYPECLEYLADANTRWAYHNAPYTLLDKVIESATNTSFSQYFNSRMRNKIGMDGFWVKVGFNNVYFSTALGMGRYGLLLLANGKWNDLGVINDTTYFYHMIHPSQSLNPSYGYLFWLNGQSKYMLPYSQLQLMGPAFPEAPKDMYAAMGKNGQLLNVVPSQGLVMVRMGDEPTDENEVANFYNNHIWYYLNKVINDPNSISNKALATNDFSIYPNPADKDLFIHNNSKIANFRVSIFNSNRQLVLSEKNANRINTENLSSGLYLVIVSGVRFRYSTVISIIH